LNWIKTQGRAFGFLMGGILAGLSAYFQFSKHYIVVSQIMLLICFFLILLAVFSPRFLIGLEKIWLKFGTILSHINAAILLTLFYFFILTPLGFFLILIKGKKGFQKKESFWILRDKLSIKTHLERLF